MKTIPLTQGKVALVDDEDHEWLSEYKWRFSNGYAIRHVKEGDKWTTTERMHRLIMNTPREMDVDHINHDRLDNRKSNLRNCTKKQNSHNTLPRHTSRFKGIHWSKSVKAWVAAISVNDKKIQLGYYTDKIDAARAYNTAAVQYYGEFAWLNDIPKTQNASDSRLLLRRSNTSGFRGVFRNGAHKKWMAKIRVKGKQIFLGMFALKLDAARAYNAAATKYHGEFAHLNDVTCSTLIS